MPSCGKTTIGKILSDELGYDFIDMDDFIVEKTGETIAEIFAKSEDLFRKYETNACIELSKKNKTVISTGGGVVKVEGNIEVFSKDIVIFINRSVDEILKNVDTETRPLLKNGAEALYNLYNERIDLYKKYANYEVINNGDISDVLIKIEEIIYNENNAD